ncbi:MULTISPECIES: TIGR02391 family protein [unclassified Streptomyces]|uniref:TIGR02391 family protein n=1 Tax=unclassified Streptomyces TaxID=2593676 RepID=UPI003D9043E1
MIVRTIAPEGMPRPTGEEGHALLDAIWAYFSEHHRWPTFDDIDRRLYSQGLVFEEVVQQLCPALLLGLGPHLDLTRLQSVQELSLTVAGAANTTGAGPALRVFLAMVRTAAGMEPAWRPADRGEQPWMRPGDVAHLPGIDAALLTEEVTFAAAALGLNEPCFHGGGLDLNGLDWRLSFGRGIRPFAGVDRLDDYWRIREQVVGPARTEAENRPFSNPPRVDVEATLRRAQVPTPAASPPPAAESPETMSVTSTLHPLIAKVAAKRFSSGFYYDAVRSAFQAVEHRVATLVGVNEVGERLMGIAFGKPTPKITVTRSTGGSLESEQNGMQFLFKGAMGALRNPRMHGPDEKDARDEAEEMLVIASFLMRRLDIEDEQRVAAAAKP